MIDIVAEDRPDWQSATTEDRTLGTSQRTLVCWIDAPTQPPRGDRS